METLPVFSLWCLVLSIFLPYVCWCLSGFTLQRLDLPGFTLRWLKSVRIYIAIVGVIRIYLVMVKVGQIYLAMVGVCQDLPCDSWSPVRIYLAIVGVIRIYLAMVGVRQNLPCDGWSTVRIYLAIVGVIRIYLAMVSVRQDLPCDGWCPLAPCCTCMSRTWRGCCGPAWRGRGTSWQGAGRCQSFSPLPIEAAFRMNKFGKVLTNLWRSRWNILFYQKTAI